MYSEEGKLTWKRNMSPLRTLLSTVPPKMYMASLMTAAAWNTRPEGISESGSGLITDQICASRS